MASVDSLSTVTPGEAAARVLVLLCTYNEAANLPELLKELHAQLPQADVLVVDDKSPDGTARIVERHPLFAESIGSGPGRSATQPTPSAARTASAGAPARMHLLERASKQGLGTATRAGLQWCLDRNYDYVINLDADLSHAPADAPRLLSACNNPDTACDVAVGSRYVAGGGMAGLSLHRQLFSRLLNGYATRLLRLPVKDCSGSFRCYRVAALRRVDFAQLSCPGYGFLEEILVALHRSGARFQELPIEFHARSQGRSKLGIGDAWGAISVIHRLALRKSTMSAQSSSRTQ